jgi:hypothetical protein
LKWTAAGDENDHGATVDDLGRRLASQAVGRFVGAGAADGLRETLAALRRLLMGDVDAVSDALDHRALEQALGLGRSHQPTDRPCARGLPGDGHAIRIAAEGRDIALHPAQRLEFVEFALLAARLLVVGLCVDRRQG